MFNPLDGWRRKLLLALGEKLPQEESPTVASAMLAPAVEPAVEVVAVRAVAPGHCPNCDLPLAMIGGTGGRCVQCAYQAPTNTHRGVSRGQIESFDGGKMKFNPSGHFRALARIVGIR